MESASVQAARWLLGAEGRYRTRHRTTTGAGLTQPTIHAATKLFRTSKTHIGAHVKALREIGRPAFKPGSVGRPTSLLESKDRALKAYAHWLIESGSLATQDLLEAACNRLHAHRDPPAPPVCHNWYL
ncbi:hypothetical protein B0T25DRAFT_496347 [Lasiosphaeria hispida]|uniref:HTH CENPB-type domain-containing protein n=1 Tax=Lasiosphaeria hispida TaxID=260671 RepID=A0AAJ0HS58_9PEZI|nr:hypothetical protein B0T25DRAFT_496347 [Lasiosphaeria hispida]